jgi:Type IV secretory system Conjugative DNA transfer
MPEPTLKKGRHETIEWIERLRDMRRLAEKGPHGVFLLDPPHDFVGRAKGVRKFKNSRASPLQHKVLAMIDEFPALRKLEILQASFSVRRWILDQVLPDQPGHHQLKSRETGYGPDETITSNCHAQCEFLPNRLQTAEHLSKLTGLKPL